MTDHAAPAGLGFLAAGVTWQHDVNVRCTRRATPVTPRLCHG